MSRSKIYLLKLAIFQHCFVYITLAVLAASLTSTNGTDYLLIARCRSNCTYDKQCHNKCLRNYLENSAYKKYGDCPPNPPSTLDSLCLNTCDGLDYKCPGVEKCCAHSCGQSCQSPHDLDKIKGLPPIPVHVLLLEKGKNYRAAQISWDMKMEEENSPTYYVVESRFHIGTIYAEHKMENDWQLHRPGSFIQDDLGNLKRYIGDLKLKPGRWYQVRVAAVNAMGTRGYSLHSRPFQLSKKPNPPQAPKNFMIGALILNENRTYNCHVSWSLSRSDLPVEKYKLSWSVFLNATDNRSRTDNSSLFKETATISAPTRYYDIQGLLPNRCYYLQIQAISVYGKRRLKSSASTQLMNTTTEGSASLDNLLMGDAGYNYKRPKPSHSLKDGTITGGSRNLATGSTIRYQFAARKSGLAVRLTWSEKGYGRYRVHICRGNRECLTTRSAIAGSRSNLRSINNQWHDAVLRRNTYEFSRLDYNTQYTVGVRIGHRRGPGYDIVRTFTTPKCERFQGQDSSNVQPNNQLMECNMS
ncbi:anosmin-1 [Anopheles cruzii]|uniref:anosmin-1 n=1 Tax=Anopheles cruzii TaxID=68878 RepID=UPI0022EC710C|nr:anosmin-1 [Anopheles cruzii]